jgi:YVTN family beta-propeller protein
MPPAREASNAGGRGTGLPASLTPTGAPTRWAVNHTLVIFNNSLLPGNFPVPLDSVAGSASSLAYDNLSGEIYVGDFGDSISVISDSTNKVVDLFEPFATTQYLTSIVYDYKNNEIFTQYTGTPGTIAVTSAATNTLVTTITVGDVSEYNTNGLAYDSGLGEVFASNGGSGNVSVISTATNKVVASINIPGGVPYALGYDPGTHQVFVANDTSGFYDDNVSVINDSSNTVVKIIDVGIYPDAFAYDGGKGEMFVANEYSATVSVINDTTDAVLTAVGVAAVPKAMAYDPAQHEVFVTCGNSNESVISDASNTVVATIPLVFAVNGAAYDSGQGEVWTLNGLITYASAISTTSNTIVANVLLTFSSRYWAYDSARQEEFLPDSTSQGVAVVSDVTDHVVTIIPLPGEPEPYRAVYDQGKGEVFLSDDASGAGLTVINDTTNTVVTTIPLPGVGPTGMAYDPTKGEIFVGNQLGSNVTIVNDTTDAIVGVVSNVGNIPWSLVYDSGKGEIFVANDGTGISGTNVTVINDTTDHIVTAINIGTDPLGDIVYDSGKGEIFVPDYGSDNVSVISDATNAVVATIPTGTFAWGAAYDAAADEIFVGNFNGDFENVTVISDITDTAVGSISPDAYTPTALAVDPVTGDLYTGDPDGTVAVITPVSGPAQYPVTFTETGLPVGTSWSVTFDATLNSSTTSSIGFSVVDGSYTFAIGAVSGYRATPSSGPVTVSGAPQTIPIVFSASVTPTYTITFEEQGLPASTTWSVTLQSTPQSSATSLIAFVRANATYTFTVGSVAGYSVAPASGSVVVYGADVLKEINFTASAPGGGSSGPGFLGLTGYEGYVLIGILAGILAVMFFLFAGWRHKPRIVFVEKGLPTGTSWSVTLDEVTKASTSEEILFFVGSGKHPFKVGPVTGWWPTPAEGTAEGGRDRVDMPITFTAGKPPS